MRKLMDHELLHLENPDHVNKTVVSKKKLRTLIQKFNEFEELLDELRPGILTLLGEGANVIHLSPLETEVYNFLISGSGVASLDIVTCQDIADCFNEKIDNKADHVTSNRIGHMLKKFGCFAQRQASSTVGSRRVWILRHFRQYNDMSNVEIAMSYEEQHRVYQVRKLTLDNGETVEVGGDKYIGDEAFENLDTDNPNEVNFM